MSSFVDFAQDGISFKLSYRRWATSTRASMAATGTRDFGYAAMAYATQAEYFAFQGRVNPGVAPAAFALLVRPNPDFRAIYPADAADAEGQRINDAIHLPMYARDIAAFEKERDILASIRTRLLASICPEATLMAGDPVDGFAGMSIPAIFAAMAAQFGRLSMDELTSIDASLDAKWTSGTISAHLVKHAAAHETLRTNGAPISAIAKIQRLSGSLSDLPLSSPDHPFRVEIINFRDSHPDLAAQVYPDFATIIERAGFAVTPATHSSTAISAVKKRPPATASAEPRKPRGPLFCSHHGNNHSHVTSDCIFLARESRKASGAGGGGAK